MENKSNWTNCEDCVRCDKCNKTIGVMFGGCVADGLSKNKNKKGLTADV